MKRTLVGGVVAAMLGLGAPVASAEPFFHYIGGCGFTVVNDTTPGGQFGGPNQWNGVLYAVVVATVHAGGTPAPFATVEEVRCEMKINGFSVGTLTTYNSVAPVLVGAEQLSFTAEPGSIVELCEDVIVEGEDHEPTCDVSTETQVVPQPVVDRAEETYTDLETLLDLLCFVTRTLTPGVPPVLDVDPNGDVTVLGIKVLDCPPDSDNAPPVLGTQDLMTNPIGIGGI